jgi:hypothetical protein
MESWFREVDLGDVSEIAKAVRVRRDIVQNGVGQKNSSRKCNRNKLPIMVNNSPDSRIPKNCATFQG